LLLQFREDTDDDSPWNTLSVALPQPVAGRLLL